MNWTCPSCRVQNDPRSTDCENCGTSRPARPSPPEGGSAAAACTGCGGDREPNGWCQAGNGFDGNLRLQPGVVCPRCRQPLPFSGACYSTDCRAFPGDEYVFDQRHWTLSRRGPGRRATVEEAVAAVQAIGLRLEGAEQDGKLRSTGDLIPVGALLFHAAVPGLRLSAPGTRVHPTVHPVPPEGPAVEVISV